MAQDPEKLAQLQALAEGGPAGLAQHQQAAAGAQAARNQALASAAGYGTSDYATSPELRASLAATAGRAAAPGVAAAENVSAAAPGLAAMDQAAADTYTSRAAQSTQSRLAAAQAKIDMEERQNQAEQQSKLAELQLEREKSTAEGAYTLSSLDEKSRALDLERAMDPDRIAGQAMKDQAAAVEDAKTKEEQSRQEAANAAASQSELEAANATAGEDPEYQQLARSAEEIQKRNDELRALGQLTPEDEEYARQINEKLDAKITGGTDAGMKLAAVEGEQSALSQGYAQQRALAELDLPRFQFKAAVDAGMDPDVAASKFLSKEDDWILSQREKQFRADTIDETQEQRRAAIDKKAAALESEQRAGEVAGRIGWDPKDVVALSRATDYTVDDIGKEVTSEAWKIVDGMAARAGQPILDQDGKQVGVYDMDKFYEDLLKAQYQKALSPAAVDIGLARYQGMFHRRPALSEDAASGLTP